ncbi:hypothetical protein ACWDT6_30145, partial [Nocardia grenadensis]
GMTNSPSATWPPSVSPRSTCGYQAQAYETRANTRNRGDLALAFVQDRQAGRRIDQDSALDASPQDQPFRK